MPPMLLKWESTIQFKSLDHLLGWTFGGKRGVSLSGIYALAKEKVLRRRRTDPLSAMDILTQKGLVKSYIHRQTPIARNHFLAAYSGGHERSYAQNQIRDYLLPRMPTGIHNRRMLYELVAKYYGKAVDLSALAEHMNIESFLVLSAWAKVDGMLSDLEYRCSDDAHEHYKTAGLIRED